MLFCREHLATDLWHENPQIFVAVLHERLIGKLIHKHLKINNSQALVAHTCNHSYLEDGDQEKC
jgi:hypothetical protein